MPKFDPRYANPFEKFDPRVDRCGLCHARIDDCKGPFHFERRPSGPNFTLQDWPYCSRCWNFIHGQADPTASVIWAEPLEEPEPAEEEESYACAVPFNLP